MRFWFVFLGALAALVGAVFAFNERATAQNNLQQHLDTGRVKVETVWREGTDAVILIEDTETGTRCYAAYGSLNCVPHP